MNFFAKYVFKLQDKPAQQSVQPTSGILRDLQTFFSLRVYTRLKPSPRPAPLRVTQAVGRQNEK
jgi:hypothetical protein